MLNKQQNWYVANVRWTVIPVKTWASGFWYLIPIVVHCHACCSVFTLNFLLSLVAPSVVLFQLSVPAAVSLPLFLAWFFSCASHSHFFFLGFPLVLAYPIWVVDGHPVFKIQVKPLPFETAILNDLCLWIKTRSKDLVVSVLASVV